MSTAGQNLKRAVHAQIERFAALRSAQRALAPSVRDVQDIFPPERVQDVLSRLRSLAQCKQGEAQSAPAGEEKLVTLGNLDDELNGISSQLLEALDRIPFAQLRASLPSTVRTYPEEVLALLNLCAANAHGHAQRIRISEYALTLIASELRGGVRSLSINPDGLSVGITALAEGHREKLDPSFDPEKVARDFRTASERLRENSDIEPTLMEMRKLKEDLGDAIFLPEIVRDVVAYNIAVWNRQAELLDQARTSDQLAEAALLFSTEIEPEPRSVEEVARTQMAGMARVEAAVARVVRGEEIEPDPAGELTLGLDPAALGAHERGAFVSDSDEPLAQVIRSMLATAVVLQQLPEGDERLRELELTPSVIQGDWIRHLSQEVQQAMRRQVAASCYEDARALSAIKHRYLHSSLTELIREHRQDEHQQDEHQQEMGSTRPSTAMWVPGLGEAIGRAAAAAGLLSQRLKRELKRPASYVGLLLICLVASVVFMVALI